MTRRFYHMEMKDPRTPSGEVNRSYIVSADLDGPPRGIHVHSGVHEQVTTLDCKVGREDDFAGVVSEAYSPLQVVSYEEFTFGVIGISRADLLRHLVELGAIEDPLAVSVESVDDVEITAGLDDLITEQASTALNHYLRDYSHAITSHAHKAGLKVNTYTLETPFSESGRPTHPVYPNAFLPQFLQNVIQADLSEEKTYLSGVIERSADAAYRDVFGDLVKAADPAKAAPSHNSEWLH